MLQHVNITQDQDTIQGLYIVLEFFWLVVLVFVPKYEPPRNYVSVHNLSSYLAYHTKSETPGSMANAGELGPDDVTSTRQLI